jgi:small-conductance mechanosensitive channel
MGYRDYFPPDFAADFLRGREAYFFGAYQWAFYAHVVSGPVTLLLGLILVSEHFRARFPAAHRFLGKTQAAIVLCLLVPSGLWMARHAETGALAGMGFALLAIVTGTSVLLGWRSAVKRNFAEHRRWMWRCYLLLCSAVVLRLIGGLATVTDAGGNWIYPLAAWASWLVPLAAFEVGCSVHGQLTGSGRFAKVYSAKSGSKVSFPALEISARR